jgi:hypothetical protein
MGKRITKKELLEHNTKLASQSDVLAQQVKVRDTQLKILSEVRDNLIKHTSESQRRLAAVIFRQARLIEGLSEEITKRRVEDMTKPSPEICIEVSHAFAESMSDTSSQVAVQ